MAASPRIVASPVAVETAPASFPGGNGGGPGKSEGRFCDFGANGLAVNDRLALA